MSMRQLQTFLASSCRNTLKRHGSPRLPSPLCVCSTDASTSSTDKDNDWVTTKLDTDTGIATLTMNQKPVNSLSLEMNQAISQALKEIENASGKIQACIVASSCPTTFSAGLDITELHDPDMHRLEKFWKSFQQVHYDLYTSRLACIAALQGHAVAGGCILAMSCHARIMVGGQGAPTNVKIGLNESQLGIVAPTWIGQLYVSTIGHALAEKHLALGTLFSPQEALEIGLVDEVVETRESVMVKAREEAAKWVKVNPQARHESTMLIRKQNVDQFLENRESDVDSFVQFVTRDSVQEAIGRYLESLQRKK